MNLGRLIFPALRWRPATGFVHEDEAIDRALALGAGGFIVFGVPGARADEIGRLTEELRHRAGRPLLIGADLERGPGQQARGLTECPPPGALASLQDESIIRWAAATTAREARRIGINWVFAPVADLDVEPANPIVQTRSFGADPERVSHAVRVWIEACQAEGALACAKHYPGHGRTTSDSHQGLPAVPLALARLAATDLAPFHAAVAAKVASVMTAHVAFPSWDPSGAPATLSPTMLGYLREGLGFDGLVVTDALIMEAVREGGERTPAAAFTAQAVAAGCDLLLYPPDSAAAAADLARALESGFLTSGRVEQAVRRYQTALGQVLAAGPSSPAPAGPTASAVAGRLLAAGLHRGPAPAFPDGFELVVVDDDQGGWYAPGPSDYVVRALARKHRYERWGGARVVLAYAEPRAAKGRAGLGPESLARLAELAPGAALIVLFGHPRLVADLPGTCPVLVAWHRQRLMQEAVAEWILRVSGEQ